ncbi:terpenoid synthase [Xylariaceae sp. FL0255]|nr:terpenoid synthase [Xylariaceae sp. FL0255]
MELTRVPQKITIFPVCIHQHEGQIALQVYNARRNVQVLAPQFTYRPHSATSNVEKVGLAVEITETLWLYDDFIENLSHDSASHSHRDIKGCLTIDLDRPSRKNQMAHLFEGFAIRLNEIDAAGTSSVRHSLRSYLYEYDSQKEPFKNLQEYIEFRISNVGFRIMESFMKWNLGISLDESEKGLSRKYYLSSGRVMGLTNDLYSWTVEKTDARGRQWNAVRVIMSQHKLSEADALVFLRGLIMVHEQETLRLGAELLEESASSAKMIRYVSAMELMLGGNCFWSATCPRYNHDAPSLSTLTATAVSPALPIQGGCPEDKSETRR